MNFVYVRTGPFKIMEVVEDDPKYLIVKFDDIDPKTGKNSHRKMRRGGDWPSQLSDIVSEKARNLIDKEVMVVTSQTTKAWSTHEWFCDVETLPRHRIVTNFGSKLQAADGISSLTDTLAYCGSNLIDCSLAKSFFDDEDEYNVFFQTMNSSFEAKYRNPKTRYVDEDITRIRLGDKKRDTGSSGGFRAVLWKAVDIADANFNYFILLKVDRKPLEKKFPEKKEMSSILANVKKLYQGKNIKELAVKAFKSQHEPEITNPPQVQRVYLTCPFEEKDECKLLGGKWDPDKKKWYVPSGLSVEKFSKWLPKNNLN